MSAAGRMRRLVASSIASSRIARVLFKHIAMDEAMLPLIVADPKFEQRVSSDQRLRGRIERLVLAQPGSGLPEWYVAQFADTTAGRRPSDVLIGHRGVSVQVPAAVSSGEPPPASLPARQSLGGSGETRVEPADKRGHRAGDHAEEDGLPVAVLAQRGLYGPVYPEHEYADDIACQVLLNGKDTDTIPVHSSVRVVFTFRLKRRVNELCSTLNFHRRDGLKVAAIASIADNRFAHVHEGRVSCEVQIRDLNFAPGRYVIMMPIADGQSYLWRGIVKEFDMVGHDACEGAFDVTHTYAMWLRGLEQTRMQDEC